MWRNATSRKDINYFESLTFSRNQAGPGPELSWPTRIFSKGPRAGVSMTKTSSLAGVNKGEKFISVFVCLFWFAVKQRQLDLSRIWANEFVSTNNLFIIQQCKQNWEYLHILNVSSAAVVGRLFTYLPLSKLFLEFVNFLSPESSPNSPNIVTKTLASVPAPRLLPVKTWTLYLWAVGRKKESNKKLLKLFLSGASESHWAK